MHVEIGQHRRMRALIGSLALVVASILPTHLVAASASELFPPIDNDLLARCQAQMTRHCLADISWALSREENRGSNLGQLAWVFAELGQWSRADELLARMPINDVIAKISKDGQTRYVEGERLAAALTAGRVSAVSAQQDPLVLSVAAARLLGYLPQENIVASDRIGKRLNEGLWKRTLSAERSVKVTLLRQWERVLDKSPNYLKAGLANKLLLIGEAGAARRVADRIEPTADDVGRDIVELWLRLGEPDRALRAIGVFKPRSRGLYKILVAKYLGAHGKLAEAGRLAVQAAEDFFAADDFARVLTAVELLAEMKNPDLAKQITLKADQLSEAKGLFRAFDVSAVGEMYGWTGDPQACLRLQAKAVGVQPRTGNAVGWGFISGPIGYGGASFNLTPELEQNVAARRMRCGDKAALNAINNRTLALNYCDYYRRGLITPEHVVARPQKLTDDDAPRTLLLELAAECHFERGDNDVALSLLHRLMEEARLSADFGAARSGAEIACVYGSGNVCRQVLQSTGELLIKSVAARKLPAQDVVEFAAVWRSRAAPR